MSEILSEIPEKFTEVYACDKSYEENYEDGPQTPERITLGQNLDHSVDHAVNHGFEFLGFHLANPIGIPSGPLLNADWVRFYLNFGFSVPVYKTVRSVFRACHPAPNCIYVEMPQQSPEFDPALLLARESLPELLVGEAPQQMGQLSITNSFGVPSMAPEVWMPDVERANSYCGEGQLLIVSIMGTEGAGKGGRGRSLVQDFAYTAAMARDAGAKVLEANFSCPNLGGSATGMLYADAENAARTAREIRTAIGKAVPLLLKLGYQSPDKLQALVEATRPYVNGYAGINTVPSNVRRADGRPALPGEGRLKSGICGGAIRRVGRQFVRDLAALRHERKDDFVIVGVGGMMQACDLTERLTDGAELAMSATAAMWDPYLALRWLQQN